MTPDMTLCGDINFSGCIFFSFDQLEKQEPNCYICCFIACPFMNPEILLKAYRLMYAAKLMAETYDANRQVCKYVHSTSRGHEAIQLATAFNLKNCDYVSPYYRDESILLGLDYSPYELMLQLLTKKDDPFSGGRSYYSHPNSKEKDKPKIIHQSSATGMQAIPTTG